MPPRGGLLGKQQSAPNLFFPPWIGSKKSGEMIVPFVPFARYVGVLKADLFQCKVPRGSPMFSILKTLHYDDEMAAFVGKWSSKQNHPGNHRGIFPI